MLYCEKCMILTTEKRCPNCGGKKLREVKATDPVYLVSKEAIWSGMVEDILNQNNIPFLKIGTLGAGIAANIGYGLETFQFFVPQDVHDRAAELLKSVFPDVPPDEESDE